MRHLFFVTTCLIALIAAALNAIILSAAEIRLFDKPIECSQTLVLLGDVAEIILDENYKADSLASSQKLIALRETVIVPAPKNGDIKTLSQTELRSRLSRCGISSLEYDITGANQITLIGSNLQLNSNSLSNSTSSNQFIDTNWSESFIAKTPNQTNQTIQQVSVMKPQVPNSFIATDSSVPAVQSTQSVSSAAPVSPASSVSSARKVPLSAQQLMTLQEQVAESISVYLNYRITNESGQPANYPWKVDLKLSHAQGLALLEGNQINEITGGTTPLLGKQRFAIKMNGIDSATGQNVIVTVETEISLSQQVVVLRRALPRGYMIRESDVKIERVDRIKGDDFFVEISDVLGKETTKALGEMTVLSSESLKKPTWVRKGDVVTVVSKSNGIEVRADAIATQDGVHGDTIQVERISDLTPTRSRKTKQESITFLARVCEPKTVEVFPATISTN
ncbi:MAG: flagellar basal body P-ring formation chaperone FlgA [Thermoguttaceae bacterium]